QELIAAWQSALGSTGAERITTVMRDRQHGALLFTWRSGDRDLWMKSAIGMGGSFGPLHVHFITGSCFDESDLSHRESLNAPNHKPSAYRKERLHTDGHASPDRRDEFVILLITALQFAQGGESLLLHLDDWEEGQRYLQSPYAHVPAPFVRSRLGAVAR